MPENNINKVIESVQKSYDISKFDVVMLDIKRIW